MRSVGWSLETALRQLDTNLESELTSERARVRHLCAYLTGDPQAAEDLAQETLLEAWRHDEQLRDPQKRSQWLSGIARNVCLHWRRRRRLELSRSILLNSHGNGISAMSDEGGVSEFDLELELERDELADLLDRAMALLPPDTRAVLVERYIRESPRAEIAAHLSLTETTVAKRLERGRLALRNVLVTTFANEVAEYGWNPSDDGGWQETRIWCPHCGRYRLKGLWIRRHGDFQLRCPGCCSEPEVYVHHVVSAADVLKTIKSFKPALSRLLRHGMHYYGAGLECGRIACPRCGRDVPLHFCLPENVPSSLRGVRGIHYTCHRCDLTGYQRLATHALSLPEVLSFWQKHPRIHALPEQEVEAFGQPAIVVGFRAVGESATLQVVVARDTYRVLKVCGTSVG